VLKTTPTEEWLMNASLHVLAPESLTAAVKAAAARDLTTASEYVRRALVERLRSDVSTPRASRPGSRKRRDRRGAANMRISE
jgi:hypothetical protein